jgi:hypothetical protein
MGGNSAWRKRVAAGGLAKGGGGAIARHRPRWGRKGKDLKLNRKGFIAGGNPKKSKLLKKQKEEQKEERKKQKETEQSLLNEPDVSTELEKTA